MQRPIPYFDPESRDIAAELAGWKTGNSPDAFDRIDEHEGDDDGRQPAFYGFAAAPGARQIHIAGYFNDEALLADVIATWQSLRWTATGVQ